MKAWLVLGVFLQATPAAAQDVSCQSSYDVDLKLSQEVSQERLQNCMKANAAFGVIAAAYDDDNIYITMLGDQTNESLQRVGAAVCTGNTNLSSVHVVDPSEWLKLNSPDQLHLLKVDHTINCWSTHFEVVN